MLISSFLPLEHSWHVYPCIWCSWSNKSCKQADQSLLWNRLVTSWNPMVSYGNLVSWDYVNNITTVFHLKNSTLYLWFLVSTCYVRLERWVSCYLHDGLLPFIITSSLLWIVVVLLFFLADVSMAAVCGVFYAVWTICAC